MVSPRMSSEGIGLVRASDAPYKKERRAGRKAFRVCAEGVLIKSLDLELWYSMTKHVLVR